LNDIYRVFIGYDPRQPVAYNVLQHSIVRNSSVPVTITPLILRQLPIKRRGLTEFTYSRFLVPYLSDFVGRSVFMDADMVVTGDIKELFDQTSGMAAVSVMQEQERFEWASLMVFSNSCCQRLTPKFIDDEKNALFDMAWAPSIGQIPPEWNHCVGYQEPKSAKLYHFTQGLPCFPETKGLPEDEVWEAEKKKMLGTVDWKSLMGTSVHAKHVLRRMVARYTDA
jgi:hypothetical protein